MDEGRSGLTHDYFANVLDSFKATIEDHGYDLTFINCSKKCEPRLSYLEHSRYRGYDGVVIACIDFSDPEVIELANSDIPLVTIDYMFNNHSGVVSNNYAGMTELMRYIVSKGHRKIAYVCGEDTAVTRNRLAAFYKVLEENNIEIPDDYVMHGAYRSINRTEKFTDALLDRPDRPTCILYSDDYSAMGGINSVRRHGLSVPEDISIAGYDGITLAAKLQPSLTTIKQDTQAIGEHAAIKLINLIEHPRTEALEQIVVDGVLVQGKSVAEVE